VTTPEGEIENYLVKRVRETGGRVRKLKWIGRNGAPDRLVWWPYRSPIIFVEVKRPGEMPDGQQEDEIKKLRDDGLIVRVIDSKELVEKIITDWAGEE
jgi:hypothetical protein